MLSSVAQTSFKQSELSALASSGGYSARSGKQCNVIGNDECSSRNWLSVQLSEKRQRIRFRGHLAQLFQEISDLFKLTPAFERSVRPQLRFIFPRNSHVDAFVHRGMKSQIRTYRPVHHIRKLYRSIPALAEKLKHSWIGKRTNFVKNIGAARSKELFERVQIGHSHGLRYSQPERLSQRRSGAIKHRITAGHFDPRRTSIRKRSRACFDKFDIAARFGTFKTPRQLDISKWIRGLLWASPWSAAT